MTGFEEPAPSSGPDRTPTSSTISPAQVHDVVWGVYVDLLAASRSPLLEAGAHVRSQLKDQVLAVLTAVADELTGHTDGLVTVVDRRLSETIGRSRAVAGMHPGQSLAAASMMFEASLPVVVRWADGAGDPTPQSTAATLLNRVILHRMSVAASGYVELLLERVHESNQLERRSLSRGLHDVIAPAVALGIQSLELHEMHRVSDPPRAASKLNSARQTLMEAIDAIRSLSEYLRVDISRTGLVGAVEKYLDSAPPHLRSKLRTVGSVDDIAPAYAQEISLIVREAIRNAVEHSGGAVVDVDLRVLPGRVSATVTDDGRGFDHETVMHGSHHVGLDSMNERAELLSGTVELVTQPGRGTTVRIVIPIDLDAPAQTLPTTQ